MASRQARRGWLALGAGLLWLGLCAGPSDAKPGKPGSGNMRDESKQIAGWVERVVVLPSKTMALAKLDTGAKTSSIHAEEIERFQRNGRSWVRYTLILKESKQKVHRIQRESPLVRKVYIKDHVSQPDARPVVELEFCMGGRRHSAHFSLVDRSSFLYSVLLGRELLAGSFVVDPEQTFVTGATCGPERQAP